MEAPPLRVEEAAWAALMLRRALSRHEARRYSAWNGSKPLEVSGTTASKPPSWASRSSWANSEALTSIMSQAHTATKSCEAHVRAV